jgi:hypothetical protein
LAGLSAAAGPARIATVAHTVRDRASAETADAIDRANDISLLHDVTA